MKLLQEKSWPRELESTADSTPCLPRRETPKRALFTPDEADYRNGIAAAAIVLFVVVFLLLAAIASLVVVAFS